MYRIGDNAFRYQGQWKDDVKHGVGLMEDHAKKTVYNGIWEDDVYHGMGSLTDKNTGITTTGLFEKGEKKGRHVETKTSEPVEVAEFSEAGAEVKRRKLDGS